ncbi:D-alanyl-D-alanine carboxypeptidase family protein [uncultured Finegoldia sp.]|uniref:D-alanyl-D-alanine carboxypeptidase family protein n=1 Tax=uncultured Finegoldia sp. TaxID=328009 RepID=UPI00261379EF|nr:serine hydrolase [uncultured Finegoldia sp.]
MRKKLAGAGIFLLMILCVVCASKIINKNKFDKLNLKSDCIYVYSIDDEKEIFSKNPDKKVYPASLTKMMTVLTAVENIDDFDKKAPIDKKSYQKLVKQNASMAGFYGNEPTTFEDLLYGTMLASAGECADSLAINVAGSKGKFVDLMNENAKNMGLNNTNFKNSEGMDEDDHYSSAKDMAILLKNSLKNEKFYKIFTTDKYTSTKTLDHPKGIEIESTVLGRLKDYEQDGFKIIGGKSGTTEKAGLCWATLAIKNNKKYIVVVMGVPFDDIRNPGDGQIQDTLEILQNL